MGIWNKEKRIGIHKQEIIEAKGTSMFSSIEKYPALHKRKLEQLRILEEVKRNTPNPKITKLPTGLCKKDLRKKRFTKEVVSTDLPKKLYPEYCQDKVYAPGVYLLEFENGVIKIGLSYQMSKRLSIYFYPFMQKIIDYRLFYTLTTRAARDLEAWLLGSTGAVKECVYKAEGHTLDTLTDLIRRPPANK